MSNEYVFSIPGVTCPSCIGAINTCIESLDAINILTFKANLSTKQLMVTIQENLSPTEVREILNRKLDDIGLPCYEIITQLPQSTFKQRMILGGVGVSFGLSLLMLPLFMSALPIGVLISIGMASTLLTLLLGMPSYKKAFHLWWNYRSVHMDTLFSVSTLTALIVSFAAFFVPGIPMMFEVGLLIFGFRYVGEALREALEDRMGFKKSFQDIAAKIVKKLENHTVTNIPSTELLPNDIIEIDAGMIIPVDGIYLSGEGRMSTAADNGDTESKPLNVNQALIAGTRLDSGRIQMKVTKVISESFLAQQDKLITDSLNAKDKSSWETQSERYLNYFIPSVFFFAGLSGLIIGFLFSPALAIQCATAVLVSACPCTLGLVTGTAVYTGMRKAAAEGMIFKNTQKLERAHQVQHVVFDLNGTLTTRNPEMDEVVALACSEHELLSHFAAIEAHSQKSIAQAIRHFAQQKGVRPTVVLNKSDIDDQNHSGLMANILGKPYYVGDTQMMQDQGISVPKPDLLSDQSIIYLARETTLLGYVILRRPLRPEALSVVSQLQKMGKTVYIYSGSNEETVKRYAKELHIPEHCLQWNCSEKTNPKSHFIRLLKQAGNRVAMIGDEVNDAAAIVESDIGIAMPIDGDPNISQQYAEAELTSRSLKPILAAFEISAQTSKNINQNLLFSLIYNGLTMLLASGLLLSIGIALNPSIGVALMIFQTSVILCNVYRFKQEKLTFSLQEKNTLTATNNSHAVITSTLSNNPTHSSITSSRNTHTDASSITNGEGFTNSDHDLVYTKGFFHQLCDLFSNRFNQSEGIGLNESSHRLT